jgi:hypothetical protein
LDLGGVLQRNNIHIKVCATGEVADTLTALRESPATGKHEERGALGMHYSGNPPYLGSTWQSKEQKDDLKHIFDGRTKKWKSLD